LDNKIKDKDSIIRDKESQIVKLTRATELAQQLEASQANKRKREI